MSTFSVQFISVRGGIGPQHIGTRNFVEAMIAGWPNPDDVGYDRVCVLEIPSPSARKRTKFQGCAYVFDRDQARRWAKLEETK